MYQKLISGMCVAQYLKPLPKKRSQLPEEIQPHLTNPLRLISKDLADQFSKRLGIPNTRLRKSVSVPAFWYPGKGRRTQFAFKYSLSIFLTSGNRDVNGEQISVTTFSGVKEYLMCSSAAAFSSAMSSPTMNDINIVSTTTWRGMRRPTVTELVHALRI